MIDGQKGTQALAICCFLWLQIWWVYMITHWGWLRFFISFAIGCSMVWSLAIGTGVLKIDTRWRNKSK